MSHIVESCPLTKLNGGLSRLHSADEDAVSWLTSYGYEMHTRRRKKKYTGHGIFGGNKGKIAMLSRLESFLMNWMTLNNIKFTYEVEQSGQLPFLDLLLNRTVNGGLKLQINRKPTHTDQYLNFTPLNIN